MENSQQELSIEQRKDILHREIAKYVRKGFQVVLQTDTTAQLIKPKSFSCLLAVLLLLIFLLPLIIYMIYYASKKDETVYLAVDARGGVSGKMSENGEMSEKPKRRRLPLIIVGGMILLCMCFLATVVAPNPPLEPDSDGSTEVASVSDDTQAEPVEVAVTRIVETATNTAIPPTATPNPPTKRRSPQCPLVHPPRPR